MTGSIRLRDHLGEMMWAQGQYRKQNLVAQFGPDITLSDLRHEIAKCEQHQKTGDDCAVNFVGLVRRQNEGENNERYSEC